MSFHDYPLGSLIGDYCRAFIGLAIVLAPLLAVPLTPVVTAVLGALAALFLLFAARTVLRQLERVELSDAGIARLRPFPKRIAWSALEGMKLAYYATRRDGGNGWMQLALRGEGRRVTVDSRIRGFAEIAARAARAAAERGLAIAPSTAANLAALGIAHPVER
jgi:hypothetical protein